MSDIGMVNLSDESSDQKFALGTKYRNGKNTYRYAQFTAAVAANDFAYLDKDWKTVELTTSNATEVSRVAVLPYAATTADYYGWVQTAGDFTGNVATGIGAGDKLYTTSTAGRLGTDSSSILVEGVTLTTASTSAGDNACQAVQEMVINAQDDS
jgi:hypothetical protein